MEKHWKKIIGPVVITVILVLYFLLYTAPAFMDVLPYGVRIAGLVIPLVLAGVLIAMLVERIKEIRSGEEDDLGKY